MAQVGDETLLGDFMMASKRTVIKSIAIILLMIVIIMGVNKKQGDINTLQNSFDVSIEENLKKDLVIARFNDTIARQKREIAGYKEQIASLEARILELEALLEEPEPEPVVTNVAEILIFNITEANLTRVVLFQVVNPETDNVRLALAENFDLVAFSRIGAGNLQEYLVKRDLGNIRETMLTTDCTMNDTAVVVFYPDLQYFIDIILDDDYISTFRSFVVRVT